MPNPISVANPGVRRAKPIVEAPAEVGALFEVFDLAATPATAGPPLEPLATQSAASAPPGSQRAAATPAAPHDPELAQVACNPLNEPASRLRRRGFDVASAFALGASLVALGAALFAAGAAMHPVPGHPTGVRIQVVLLPSSPVLVSPMPSRPPATNPPIDPWRLDLSAATPGSLVLTVVADPAAPWVSEVRVLLMTSSGVGRVVVPLDAGRGRLAIPVGSSTQGTVAALLVPGGLVRAGLEGGGAPVEVLLPAPATPTSRGPASPSPALPEGVAR